MVGRCNWKYARISGRAVRLAHALFFFLDRRRSISIWSSARHKEELPGFWGRGSFYFFYVDFIFLVLQKPALWMQAFWWFACSVRVLRTGFFTSLRQSGRRVRVIGQRRRFIQNNAEKNKWTWKWERNIEANNETTGQKRPLLNCIFGRNVEHSCSTKTRVALRQK